MEIPVKTVHLFRPLDKKLLELLRSLPAAAWNKPTRARQWTVKDIAAHLLDGNLRIVSVFRDNYIGDPPGKINSYQELVAYLNRLNADWVVAMRRISSTVLINLLESSGEQYSSCIESLDPWAPSRFPVDWAGEQESLNWFHVAREYTEKWHHQQQIREAVGMPGILTKEFYYPVLDTFMRALPHVYRNTMAPMNTIVRVTITGDSGGSWQIIRKDNGWSLTTDSSSASAEAVLDAETSWQLFTKGLTRAEADEKVAIHGDKDLGSVVLNMITVMAV